MKTHHGRATLLGIGIGIAGSFAYLVSCGSPSMSSSNGDDSAGGSADRVSYSNARSGLKAATVQTAIDEIGTTVRAATTTARTAMTKPKRGVVRSAHADDATTGTTTWSVQVTTLNTASEALEQSAGGTITFTESSPGQGSYTTSGDNVLMKAGLFGQPATTAQSGKYFIVGGALAVTAKAKTGGAASGSTWRLVVSNGGQTMTLDDGAAFLVMTKN